MATTTLGLLGFPLTHSFSQGYFRKKFADLGIIDYEYDLFSFETLDEFTANVLVKNDNLRGFNVTIPHKIAIIGLLDALDETAQAVGAVNTVLKKNGKLIGFNTDIHLPFPQKILEKTDIQALVLGTGGASKAVIYALNRYKIPFTQVSRTGDASTKIMSYALLKTHNLADYALIINTTPLGMYPNIATKPDLNYDQLTAAHFLYDLVYNPAETAFLREGIMRRCRVQNGLPMLYAQAEAAWSVWTA
jgi:shikimate dehydrogenase